MENKKECRICGKTTGKLVKGACLTCYSREQYHKRMLTQEQQNQKRVLFQSVDYVRQKTLDRSFSFSETFRFVERALHGIGLMFLSQANADSKEGGPDEIQSKGEN
jgi:hypothetical protein